MPPDHHLLLHYIELIVGLTIFCSIWPVSRRLREARLHNGKWHVFKRGGWYANNDGALQFDIDFVGTDSRVIRWRRWNRATREWEYWDQDEPRPHRGMREQVGGRPGPAGGQVH